MDIEWWRNGSVNLQEKSARIARCAIFSILINSLLDPREAFFGGHTENIVIRYEVMNMEKIHYVNVCSLYPYTLKTSTFPLDQPTIYIGEQCSELIDVASNFNLDSVEDIIRCIVLPRDLFHPILLYRVQGKLLFGLCRSYCETFS